MGASVSEDESVYRWEPATRFERRIIELDRETGKLHLENEAPNLLKYVLYILMVILLIGIAVKNQVLLNSGAVASLILFFGFRHFVDVPRHEDYVITSIAISKHYFASILLAGVFAVFSSFSTSGTLQIVYVVGGLLILGEHFAQGSLPIDSDYLPNPGGSQSFLHIPVLGLVAPVGSYALVNLFNLLRASALPYWSVVSLTAVFAVVGTRGYGMACRDALDRVRLDRNASFPSKPIRVVAALLYLCVNVLSLAMLVFWVDFLAIGISGGGLIQDFTPSGIELFTQIYANLDAVFQPLPLLSPRGYSLLFASLLFFPTLLLIGIWLAFLVLNVLLKVDLLRKGRRVSFSGIDSSDISVISVDIGRPLIKPLSLFFGLKKCVIVDESVLDFLDENRGETQAVLAHEVYHLRNREVLVNILSSIFALAVFGGKNALLAFYDYPRIEEEADRYAAEKFGAESLQDALRKMEYLQVQAAGESRIKQLLGMPGFTGSRTRAEGESTDDPQEEAPLLQRVLIDFLGPYDLFYGTVLFDQAHRSVDERIEWISELDT